MYTITAFTCSIWVRIAVLWMDGSGKKIGWCCETMQPLWNTMTPLNTGVCFQLSFRRNLLSSLARLTRIWKTESRVHMPDLSSHIWFDAIPLLSSQHSRSNGVCFLFFFRRYWSAVASNSLFLCATQTLLHKFDYWRRNQTSRESVVCLILFYYLYYLEKHKQASTDSTFLLQISL